MKQIIIMPMDNADFRIDCLVFIKPTVQLMDYLNTCIMIQDEIDGMGRSQIYRVEYHLPSDMDFMWFEHGWDVMDDMYEEEIRVVESDDVPDEGVYICDTGNCVAIHRYGDDVWFTFRSYVGDERSEEMWFDITKQELFGKIEEVLNETETD